MLRLRYNFTSPVRLLNSTFSANSSCALSTFDLTVCLSRILQHVYSPKFNFNKHLHYLTKQTNPCENLKLNIGRSSLQSSQSISFQTLPSGFNQELTKCSNYSTNAGSSGLPVLTLYTKDPCPLCDEALDILSPHLHHVVLDKVDITAPENKQWWKEYRYDIPVFHLNGTFLMKHRADVDMFLNAIDSLKKNSE